MYLESYIKIKDTLLNCNTFLNKGFEDVMLLELSEPSGIYMRHNNDLHPIGIDDRFGNFFYIRKTGKITYGTNDTWSVPTRIIIFTKGMDVSKLIECILNCLVPKCNDYISITGIDTNFENILKSEGVGILTIKQLLNKFINEEMISIDCNVLVEYVPNNCECNPCKSC